MVGPGASLGLPGAAAGQKGLGWRGEQTGGAHTAPPIIGAQMPREGVHPHPHPWDASSGSEAPGFPWPSY